MGSSRGLRVVLHRKCGQVQCAKALDDVVVEADVAHLDSAKTSRRVDHFVPGGFDRKTVVLRGNFHAATEFVEHGLVDSPMAIFEFVGVKAQCSAEKLVAKTDPKKR